MKCPVYTETQKVERLAESRSRQWTRDRQEICLCLGHAWVGALGRLTVRGVGFLS